jgi:antitoxin ParD1/3/4
MGKNTSVVLGEMQERFIREQIAKGRYATVSEAIRESVSLLEERELKLAALRAAIDEGDASGDPQPFDFDAFLAERQAWHLKSA